MNGMRSSFDFGNGEEGSASAHAFRRIVVLEKRSRSPHVDGLLIFWYKKEEGGSCRR